MGSDGEGKGVGEEAAGAPAAVLLRILVDRPYTRVVELFAVSAVRDMSLFAPQSPTPPQYVFWYHNDHVVNYDGSRSVAVSTEPGPRTHSRLVITHASRADSGNYTCSAPDTEPDTINVYVSQGA